MSEIIKLNVQLQNNPFAGYIIPLIEYFNDPHARARNPFEALSVAILLKQRSASWSLGALGAEPGIQDRWFEGCWCPDAFGLFGYRWVSPCSKCKTLEAPTDRQSISPTVPLEAFINNLTRELGVNSAFTPIITTFKQQLSGINTDLTNSWVFFNQLIDVFFENVSFIDYFLLGYHNGIYADAIQALIGGRFQEDYNPTGLLVETISDGGAGTPGTKAVNTIQVGATDAGVAGTYWTMYFQPTKRIVAWVSSLGVLPPVVPLEPGVTDVYVPMAINPADGIDIIAAAIVTAFIGVPGYDSVVQGPFDTVVFTNTYEGTVPVSDFTPLFGTWVGGFVDGTPAIPGIGEETKISYAKATVSNLIGQWFKIFGAPDLGALFYYQTAAELIDPATLGTTYTTAVAINLPQWCLPDGPCPDDAEAIQRVTRNAILGTGLFVMSAVDGCCKCKSSDDPANCCGPCDTFKATAVGDFTDADGGTANMGGTYQNTDVIAPDGTVFATNVEDDFKYAEIWNNYLVPYWKGLGNDIHYLKPVAASNQIWCWISSSQKAQIPGPGPCPPLPNKENVIQGSLFLQTSYHSVTGSLPFNAPSSTRSITVKAVCPSCYW